MVKMHKKDLSEFVLFMSVFGDLSFLYLSNLYNTPRLFIHVLYAKSYQQINNIE